MSDSDADTDADADTPREKKLRPFEITGTFDIEAWGWSNFAVAAIYDGKRPVVFYDGDAMIDYLIAEGGMWFAHAGGVYDLLYVLERCRARGIACQADRAQHRITRLVIGSLTLRDSYSLWPVPLDDICGAIGEPIPHLPWPCICEERHKQHGCHLMGCRGCGGYCQIRERATAGDPDLEDYVKADVKRLYDGIVALDDFCVDKRIFLRGTIGQTAWINAQTELGIPDSSISWEIWRHARRADKGGRGEIIRPRVPVSMGSGTVHDICNAYPAQLARAQLPVGYCRELGGKRAALALAQECPGVYTCTVEVPDDLFLPPLSWHQGGRLTFPTGEFGGTWALPELSAALDRGVKIKEIHAALIWEATAPIFKELIERWYEIRREVGRKTPFGQYVGRMAKAITGKLAERPDRSRVTMHPSEIKVCLRRGECRDGCTKTCGAYEQLDLAGHIYSIPYKKLGPSAYPQWSAYLRAMTRIQWLEQAERFGTDLVFGNTDSLWTLGRMTPEPVGDDLGQWEYQHAWEDLDVPSLTAYAFRDPKEATIERTPIYETRHGELTGRVSRFEEARVLGPLHIRGVPGLTEEDWKRRAGEIDRGIVTFGSSVRSASGNLFQKRTRRWSLPKKDRVWYGARKLGPGGITYPVDAQELRELTKRARARAA